MAVRRVAGGFWPAALNQAGPLRQGHLGRQGFPVVQSRRFFLGFAQGVFYNRPNPAVKGTRRTLAVLQVYF